MADTLTPAERSERMSRIRSSDTSPELAIRRELHKRGLRYTLGNKDLPGKPDVVFRRKRIAVFVHGCFWHRHENCKVANMPKSNTVFWRKKFDRNVARDQKARAQLEELGWRVEVVWECELGPKDVARMAASLEAIVKGRRQEI
jgi:DNA mismatch endonuclease (patch repair protein)